MNILHSLHTELKHSPQYIHQFAVSAPNRYKIYTIPKRTSGYRIIAHPSKELKQFQRILINVISPEISISDAAYAYVKGKNIKQNATQHQHSSYLLKMDFQNFFHSITPTMLKESLKSMDIELTPVDQFLLNQICFWKPKGKNIKRGLILSIGAPSSPLISNIIMYEFDKKISKLLKPLKINYTRYADDITFSTNAKGALFIIPNLVKSILKDLFSNQISVNESKTKFSSKGHNRHVTGITINNENQLSIGRARKRKIHSMVHSFKIGKIPSEDILHLQGLLNFAYSIEINFRIILEKKYSEETLQSIYSYRE